MCVIVCKINVCVIVCEINVCVIENVLDVGAVQPSRDATCSLQWSRGRLSSGGPLSVPGLTSQALKARLAAGPWGILNMTRQG